jgi:hypothetical protein
LETAEGNVKTLIIDFNYAGKTYSAAVEFWPATRDVRYLPNGDPGYPGDPCEMNFLTLNEVGEDGIEIDAMPLLEDNKMADELWDAAINVASETHDELLNGERNDDN